MLFPTRPSAASAAGAACFKFLGSHAQWQSRGSTISCTARQWRALAHGTSESAALAPRVMAPSSLAEVTLMACKCDHVQSATPPGPDSCLAKFEEGAGLGCETRNHRLDHWHAGLLGPGR